MSTTSPQISPEAFWSAVDVLLGVIALGAPAAIASSVTVEKANKLDALIAGASGSFYKLTRSQRVASAITRIKIPIRWSLEVDREYNDCGGFHEVLIYTVSFGGSESAPAAKVELHGKSSFGYWAEHDASGMALIAAGQLFGIPAAMEAAAGKPVPIHEGLRALILREAALFSDYLFEACEAARFTGKSSGVFEPAAAAKA